MNRRQPCRAHRTVLFDTGGRHRAVRSTRFLNFRIVTDLGEPVGDLSAHSSRTTNCIGGIEWRSRVGNRFLNSNHAMRHQHSGRPSPVGKVAKGCRSSRCRLKSGPEIVPGQSGGNSAAGSIGLLAHRARPAARHPDEADHLEGDSHVQVGPAPYAISSARRFIEVNWGQPALVDSPHAVGG